MKVLLLNGSANKKGNTFTALSEVAGQLEKNGIEAEIMQLGNKPVRGCIACGQCRMKQLGRCAFDDDVCNRIVDKLNEADALIFQTEKTMKEAGDKLPADLKSQIETALGKLKDAHKAQDIAAIDAAIAELNNAWQAASAQMYQQTGQSGAGAGPQADPNAGANQGGNTQGGDETIQDADFEEVH